MRHSHIPPSILIIIVLVLKTSVCLCQQGSITLGERAFENDSGRWYQIVNERFRVRVDISTILFKYSRSDTSLHYELAILGIDSIDDVCSTIGGEWRMLKIRQYSRALIVAQSLASSPNTKDVHFDIFMDVHKNDTGDELLFRQWHLLHTQVDDAWDLTTGDSSITVAVIDMGAQYNHEDLEISTHWRIGWDFTDNDADPYCTDREPHATAVAGLIAAGTNDGHVAGVAGGWKEISGWSHGCRIVYFRTTVFDDSGKPLISTACVAKAIDSAVAWGVKVINMSFGTLADSIPEVRDAINRAVNNHGVVCVASAGNEDLSVICNPARQANVIAVGATDSHDRRVKKYLRAISGEVITEQNSI